MIQILFILGVAVNLLTISYFAWKVVESILQEQIEADFKALHDATKRL